MDQVYLTKLNKRLSLVEPTHHVIHSVLVSAYDAYYLLIKKDNGAYLIAATDSLRNKVGDQLHLINDGTGNTLDYGHVTQIFKPSELKGLSTQLRATTESNELYFYIAAKSDELFKVD